MRLQLNTASFRKTPAIRGLEKGILLSFMMIAATIPGAGADVLRYGGQIPRDEVVELEVQGHRLSVPAGYMNPWPVRFDYPKGQVQSQPGLAFAFRMPSRQYPERNRLNERRFRLMSADFGIESIVEVFGVKFDVPESDFIESRWVRNPAAHLYYTPEQPRPELGLSETVTRDGQFVRYRELDETSPRVHMRCDSQSRHLPNPLCDGFAYFRDTKLQIGFFFSTADLKNWREFLLEARAMIERWRKQ